MSISIMCTRFNCFLQHFCCLIFYKESAMLNTYFFIYSGVFWPISLYIAPNRFVWKETCDSHDLALQRMFEDGDSSWEVSFCGKFSIRKLRAHYHELWCRTSVSCWRPESKYYRVIVFDRPTLAWHLSPQFEIGIFCQPRGFDRAKAKPLDKALTTELPRQQRYTQYKKIKLMSII